jgi:hypothetical protein
VQVQIGTLQLPAIAAGEAARCLPPQLKKPMASIRTRAEELHIPIAGTGIGRAEKGAEGEASHMPEDSPLQIGATISIGRLLNSLTSAADLGKESVSLAFLCACKAGEWARLPT